MDTATRGSIEQDEVPLAHVLRVVWKRKWLIASGALLCGIAAGVAAALSPNRYEAAIVVSPVTQNNGSGLSGTLSTLASQFGGLASLAGISVATDNKKWETLAVLQSQALTERYIDSNHLLPVLFAKRWDPVNHRWRVSDASKVPTLWKANRFFDKSVRSVNTDAKTGLVTMTITWTSPEVAAQWANGLVRMTNDYLREQTIEETQRNIAYLSAQAGKTDLVGARQAIYAILENEINKEMLARGSEEYALKVIDPATPPERRSSPLPWVWIAVGVLAGGLLSVLGVLIADRARELLDKA